MSEETTTELIAEARSGAMLFGNIQADGMQSLLTRLGDALERAERDVHEARRIAEAYRQVWEKVSAAVDETPNPDPLPWEGGGHD